ncbi:MAG TPA: hypothetical protein VM260_20620, partial [Pirellula sp.]|nr:hypothetical protein [Pirellula sp.]
FRTHRIVHSRQMVAQVLLLFVRQYSKVAEALKKARNQPNRCDDSDKGRIPGVIQAGNEIRNDGGDHDGSAKPQHPPTRIGVGGIPDVGILQSATDSEPIPTVWGHFALDQRNAQADQDSAAREKQAQEKFHC